MHRLYNLVCCAFLVAALGVRAQTHVSGTIDSDTHWTLAGSPYIVDANLAVTGLAQPTLNIEAGVEVRFTAGTNLDIGSNVNSSYKGRIIASGTDAQPILFTSDGAQTPGAWDRLFFRTYVLSGSLFEHCEFAYGGASTAMVQVRGGQPVFRNCLFRDAVGKAIEPYADNSTFQLDSCEFTACGDAPISTHPELVPFIGPDQLIHGNAVNAIQVEGGTIRTSGLWEHQTVPFHIQSDISINNNSSPPVLRIVEGNQVLFPTGGDLFIGYTSNSSYRGGLIATGVEFAGQSSGPGSWNGIRVRVYSVADSVQLVDCVIRDAGQSASVGAFHVDNNAPGYLLQGCELRDSGSYGVYDAGSDTGSIRDCQFIGNQLPISVKTTNAAWIGTGNTYSGNADNRIEVRPATIRTSTAWTTQSVPFHIIDNFAINQAAETHPTLTLPYGCVLEFAHSKRISIGYTSNSNYRGALEATGVTFRGDVDSSGHWDGLYFDVYSIPSTLIGCTIRNAGNGAERSIQINTSDVVISGCTIEDGLGDGIYALNGNRPEIAGTNITSCTAAPLSIFVNDAGAVLPGNNFAGNGESEIEVRGGTITESAVWEYPGVPYRLTSAAYISSTTQPVLEVRPGVIVQLPDNTAFTIGSSSNSNYTGAIRATGATFTRTDGGSFHKGLYFAAYSDDAACLLEDCIIEYGAVSSSWGGVRCNNSSPTLRGLTIRENNGWGLLIENTSLPLVEDCHFENNAAAPISVYANNLECLGTGNSYSGNVPDRIHVIGDVVDHDQTWQDQGVALDIRGDVWVYTLGGARLTIESGSRLEFQPGTRLTIGNSSNSSYFGALTADGVWFTAATPIPGSWDGISFARFLNEEESLLENCVIEYGGESGLNANIYIYYSSPRITHCLIRHADENAIRITGAPANPVLTSNVIFGQDRGVVIESGSALIGGAAGNGNSIISNATWGVQNLSGNEVDATWNWWGSASGPSGEGPGTGDAVSIDVLYDPWRTTALGDGPATFDLLAPVQAAITPTLHPLLDWEDALDPSPADTVRYRLEISTDASYGPAFVTTIDSLLASRYQVVDELVDDTRYWWRVTAFDQQEQETFSNQIGWYFDVYVEEAPSAPVPTSPAAGATVHLTSALLQWEAAVDPDPGDQLSYRVYLAPTAAFSNADSIDTDETGVFTPFCTPATYRYWKVRAVDTTGRSSASSIYSFYVDAAAGPRPVDDLRIQPESGDAVRLEWSPIPGADQYRILKSNHAYETGAAYDLTTDLFYLDSGVTQIPGPVSYQVTALDNDLLSGSWRNLAGQPIH